MSNVAIFTKDQEAAITAFMDFMFDSKEKFFVIQGAAGTGKSFLLKHLADSYEAKTKVYQMMSNKKGARISSIQFAASTNKAVAVLDNFLNGENEEEERKDKRKYLFGRHCNSRQQRISTIHKLLGLKLVNNMRTGVTELVPTNNQPYYDHTLLFIDEASFIDQELFDYINEGTASSCKVVLVGDYYQLAPVGDDKTIMESLDCKKVVMNEVVRNSGEILKTSHNFRETVTTGIFQNIPFNNDSIIYADGDVFKQLVDDNFKVPGWHPDKAKILAWTNARVQEYNTYVRMLNGLPELISVGETVMTNSVITAKDHMYQIDSNVTVTEIADKPAYEYDVEGRHLKINDSHWGFMPNKFSEQKRLLSRFAKEKAWGEYFAVKNGWLDLRSAYASSVHKAQGSTYEKVFVDLGDIGRNWEAEAVARLLYVAISRGAKQVICNGKLPPRYSH
jgi:energy-coupling factor transporter ATP-binding protein EcfA2